MFSFKLPGGKRFLNNNNLVLSNFKHSIKFLLEKNQILPPVEEVQITRLLAGISDDL